MVEGGRVLTYGPAVGIQQSWDSLPDCVIEGFVEVAGDLRSILALEVDVFGLRQLELRDQRVVCFGEARRFPAATREEVDFVGAVEKADLSGDDAVFAKRIRSHVETAANGARDLPARNCDAAEILRAIIFGDEIDGAAIGGKARPVHAAVKCGSENLLCAAYRWSDGQVLRGVINGFDVGLADEGDPLAIRGPGGRVVGAGIGGDLREVSAFVRIVRRNDPDVGVEIAVRVGRAAIAGEGQRFAVR